MPQARDIMTPNPMTCQETDTVYDAVRIMKSADSGVVPIVDQNQACIGVITDRDICMQVILNNMDPRSTMLADIMSRDLLTCRPDEDLNRILDQMEQRQVKRIIVTDQNNRCVGIISEADIAQRVGDQHKVGELAKGIYS
jgi:CBS domain-containing protein